MYETMDDVCSERDRLRKQVEEMTRIASDESDEQVADALLRLKAVDVIDALKSERDSLKLRLEDLESSLVEQGAILEAVTDALKGVEPSDFMLSFPDVYHAWWVYRVAYPKP